MTAEIINIEDASERLERDRQAFRLKLHGVPNWQIAETLKCSREEIQRSLTRMCAGVTPELKVRTLEVELERLDDLYQVYYKKAREGDAEATAICIRLMDRRAKYLGLDVLPRAEAAADDSREPSSFEKIREAIFSVARGPVIDGEVVKDDKGE